MIERAMVLIYIALAAIGAFALVFAMFLCAWVTLSTCLHGSRYLLQLVVATVALSQPIQVVRSWLRGRTS